MNVSVSPTSKGAFDAHHEPPLIVGKLLQRKSIKRESNSEALYPKRKISYWGYFKILDLPKYIDLFFNPEADRKKIVTKCYVQNQTT